MTVAVLLIPLVGAALALLGGAARQRAAALLATIATFVAALFLPGGPGVELPWIPGFGAYFALSPEGAGGLLVLAAALVMIPTVLQAGLRVGERPGGFLALLLLLQAGLNGLFLAKDLVLFYLFWEATLIPSLLLLGVWGRERRRQVALKYLLYTVAGSFLMLITILAIKPLSGAASYRIADLLAATQALSAQPAGLAAARLQLRLRGQAPALATPLLAARLPRAEPPLRRRRRGGHLV